MLKRDRTSDERQWDGMVKRGLMRLGEHPTLTSSGIEVTEPLRPPNPFPHFLFWDRMGRKGQKCRILNPGQKNARSLQIEFEDGFIAVVNRRAIRRSD